MSELKAYKMIDEDYCDDAFCVVPSDVYLKSEADKLIAELNMRICDGDEDFEIANNQINRLMKIVRHQKYKRCLAMSLYCESLMRDAFLANPEYIEWLDKWRERWLKIAEQFKEAKCQ